LVVLSRRGKLAGLVPSLDAEVGKKERKRILKAFLGCPAPGKERKMPDLLVVSCPQKRESSS